MKFRICGAVELFTFAPKNDNLSENATTISIEVSKTLVFRKRFKLFRSDDTINCIREIQEIAIGLEETQHRMSHKVLTTFAPPQHYENAWKKV